MITSGPNRIRKLNSMKITSVPPSWMTVTIACGADVIIVPMASRIDSSLERPTKYPAITRTSPIQNQILNLWRQYQSRRRMTTSCSLSAASAP